MSGRGHAVGAQWGDPGSMGARLIEWAGVPLTVVASYYLLGKPLSVGDWSGAWIIVFILFARSADVIEEHLRRRAISRAPVWRGIEFAIAGMVLPTAGMPLWVGIALVAVGLAIQSLTAARYWREGGAVESQIGERGV